jgi:hypothetical protein
MCASKLIFVAEILVNSHTHLRPSLQYFFEVKLDPVKREGKRRLREDRTSDNGKCGRESRQRKNIRGRK